MTGHHGRGRWIGVLLIGAALLVLAAAPVAHGADRVYFANANDTISYANLDGSGGRELNVSGATPNRIRGVAIDSATGQIYWANSGNNTISYTNLDGSGGGGELNVSGATPSYPHGVAIDPAAGRIYWANDDNNTISFAKLDGSGGGGELNLSGATPDQPYGVAIDPAAGRIYWANVAVGNNTISYAKLDDSGGGGELNTSGATPDKPHAVAIDHLTGKIYWGNLNSTISYANLDDSGGGGELGVSGAHPDGPVGVAIDPPAGKIYWTNLGSGTISYANVDGSGGGGELNLSGTNSNQPRFLALLRAPEGAGAPQVTGGSRVGSTFSCSQGSWAPDLLGSYLYRAPRTLAYQWSRDGADIAGATDSSYTAYAAGDYRCRVTATNAAGSTSQTSAPHAATPNQGCVRQGLRLNVAAHSRRLMRTIVLLDGRQILVSKNPDFKLRIPSSELAPGRHRVLIERDYRSGTMRRSTFSFSSCRGGRRSPHIRAEGMPERGTCMAKAFRMVVTTTRADRKSIVVRLDGETLLKPARAQFALPIDVPKLKPGPHWLTIRAADRFEDSSVSITKFVRCGLRRGERSSASVSRR